jgi:Flp pilus assembly protein TadB
MAALTAALIASTLLAGAGTASTAVQAHKQNESNKRAAEQQTKLLADQAAQARALTDQQTAAQGRADQARQTQRLRLAAASGRFGGNGTILTGPQGITGPTTGTVGGPRNTLIGS